MNWVIGIAGMTLVVIVLRDVFHTLFHPIGRGSVAPQVMKLAWRVLHTFSQRRHIATLSGPLGVVAVIGTWTVTAVVGWTLIYFAQMPDGLSYSSGLDPSSRAGFLDSLYLSLVAVTTLGFGDIVPTSPTLRIAAPLEALFGFILLTSAVSWVLQIYPALHRRRALALSLSTLRDARQNEPELGVDAIPTDVLTALTSNMVESRNDFSQYRAMYYFRDLEADASLAASLGFAMDLANEAATGARPQTRVAGAMLRSAVDRLAALLDKEFLHLGGDTAAVVRAYAAHHSHA